MRHGAVGLVIAVLAAAAAVVSAQVSPSITPSNTLSPTPTATLSFGSSRSPSTTPRPVPYGTIGDVFVLDCNGGVHILPGTPAEVNLNIKGARHLLNFAADEIRGRVACVGARVGPACASALTPEVVDRHFVPSMPMLLNWLRPYGSASLAEPARLQLPDACQAHDNGVPFNGLPAFGSTFFDSSAIGRSIQRWLDLPAVATWLRMPQTCNYVSWFLTGCRFAFTEPITGVVLNVAVDSCPASSMPYVSVTCAPGGTFCQNFFRPCQRTNAGSCGGDPTLVCRKAFPGSGDVLDGMQLLAWMDQLNLLNNLTELTGYQGAATPLAALQIAGQRLRAKLFAMWNMSGVVNEIPGPTTQELTFCLPPEDTANNVVSRLKATLTETQAQALPADPTGHRTTCITNGCDLVRVGDGRCHTECYSAECLWDGGDCGGPPVALPAEDPGQLTAIDGTVPAGCRVLRADVTAAAAPGNPTIQSNWEFNYWEECNNVGTCAVAVGGAASCTCPTNCVGGSFQGGLPPGTALASNPKCLYCLPRRAPCAGTVAGCNRQLQQFTGLQDRLAPWDGALPNGRTATDPDRKSGYVYYTPGSMFGFTTPGSSMSNLRPIAQGTCAGEVGLNVLNSNLQFGVHVPVAQDVIAFLVQWVRDTQASRPAAMGVAPPAGQLVPPPLTNAQFDVRFMPHQAAYWLYQYTGFGAPWLRTFPTAPLAAAGNIGGLGPQLVSGAPLGPGAVTYTDFLDFPFARKEPWWPSTAATPLSDADWVKGWRANVPASCGLLSAVTGRDAGSAYGRSCRFTYNGLQSLLQARGNVNSPDLQLHFDGRNDRCAGAATYLSPQNAQPVPGVNRFLTPQAAADALPAWTFAIGGAASALLAYPQACGVPGDCPSVAGMTSDCVDLDTRLMDLSTRFFGRSVNPFTDLLFGGYNAGQTCGTFADTRGALRRFMKALGGDRSPDGPLAANNPSFCFYSPDPIDTNSGGWLDAAHTPGTCGGRPFNANNRVCVPNVVAPTPTNLAPPPNAGGQSAPITINNLVALDGPTELYPPPTASGVTNYAPFPRTPDAAATVRTSYIVSVPVWTVGNMTNTDREHFRWALSVALTRYGVPLVPDAVIMTSVADNPFAFTPLPGPGPQVRAGVQIGFDIESPNALVSANVSAQLSSSVVGTLGGDAGRVFADLGIVPLGLQAGFVFRQVFPVIPPTPLPGGTVFGIIIAVVCGLAVFSLALHYGYLKPRGKRVPFVPSPEAIAGCCGASVALCCRLAGRAPPKKGGAAVSTVGAKKPGAPPPRSGRSAAEMAAGGAKAVSNPLAAVVVAGGAPAKPGAAAAGAAKPGAAAAAAKPAAPATAPAAVIVVPNAMFAAGAAAGAPGPAPAPAPSSTVAATAAFVPYAPPTEAAVGLTAGLAAGDRDSLGVGGGGGAGYVVPQPQPAYGAGGGASAGGGSGAGGGGPAMPSATPSATTSETWASTVGGGGGTPPGGYGGGGSGERAGFVPQPVGSVAPPPLNAASALPPLPPPSDAQLAEQHEAALQASPPPPPVESVAPADLAAAAVAAGDGSPYVVGGGGVPGGVQ